MKKGMIWTFVVIAVIVIGIFVYLRMVKTGKIGGPKSTDCCAWDANDKCLYNQDDARCMAQGTAA